MINSFGVLLDDILKFFPRALGSENEVNYFHELFVAREGAMSEFFKYLDVTLCGSTISFFPRLIGSKSTSDSKQPGENSKLPIFTTEEHNFWPKRLFAVFPKFLF